MTALTIAALLFGSPRVTAQPDSTRPKIDTESRAKIRTLQETISASRARGDYAGSLSGARDLAELTETRAGRDHWMTRSARRMVTGLEKLSRLSDEDKKLAQRADQEMFRALELQRQGHWRAVEALSRSAFAIRQKIVGVDHPDTEVSLERLGEAALADFRPENSAAIFRELRRLRRRTLGEDHPQTLAATSGLAVSLDYLLRQAEAEELHDTALRFALRFLDPTHVLLPTLRSRFASCLQSQGQTTREEVLRRAALKHAETTTSETSPLTASACGELAECLERQGRHDEAEPLFLRYRQILEASLDPEDPLGASRHPAVLRASARHSVSLAHNHEYDDALDLMQRALDRSDAIDPPDQTLIAALLRLHGALYEALDDPGTAEVYYNDEIELRRKTVGADHRETSTALANRARCFSSLGRHHEAAALLADAFRSVSATAKLIAHEDSFLLRLVDHLQTQEMHVQAVELLRLARSSYEAEYGIEHPLTNRTVRALAIALTLAGSHREAQAPAKSAYEQSLRIYGPQGYEALPYLDTWARNCRARGDLPTVAELREKATKIAEARFGAEHRNTKRARVDLAAARIEEGKTSEAKKILMALAETLDAEKTAEARLLSRIHEELSWLAADNATKRTHLEQSIALAADPLEPRRTSTPLHPRLLLAAHEAKAGNAKAAWTHLETLLEKSTPIVSPGTVPLEKIAAVVPKGSALVSWLDVPARPGVVDSTAERWALILPHGAAPRCERLDATAKLDESLRKLESLEAVAHWIVIPTDPAQEPALRRLAEKVDLTRVDCGGTLFAQVPNISFDGKTAEKTIFVVAVNRPAEAGKTPTTQSLANDAPETGALVDIVDEKSNAERAGIRPDDVLLAYDGKVIRTSDDLGGLIREVSSRPNPPASVRLRVWRAGKTLELQASFGRLGVRTFREKPRVVFGRRARTDRILELYSGDGPSLARSIPKGSKPMSFGDFKNQRTSYYKNATILVDNPTDRPLSLWASQLLVHGPRRIVTLGHTDDAVDRAALWSKWLRTARADPAAPDDPAVRSRFVRFGAFR